MGLGDFFQGIVDTVTLPLDVVADVVEGGKNERTKKKVEKIGEDIEGTFE